MTARLEKAITELRKLPEADQDAVAEGLSAYLSQGSGYRLTDDQVAELEARLVAPLDVLTEAKTEAFFRHLMA